MIDNRIVGLASGIDTDAWVEKLMQAQRIPMDKLNQNKQLLEWKRDDYRDINKMILELRTSAFNMRLSEAYSAYTSASSDSSAVSVSATSVAVEGSYKLKVNQLAKAAALTSSSALGATLDSTLGDLGLTADTVLQISGQKGSAAIAVKTTDTLDVLVKQINNQSRITGVSVMYDETLDHLFFSSTGSGKEAKVELGSNNMTLLNNVMNLPGSTTETGVAQTITGNKSFVVTDKVAEDAGADQSFRISYGGADYDFTVSATTTMSQLMNAINGSDLGKAGVSAYLDASGNLAFLNQDDTKALSFSDETGDAFNVLFALGLEDEDGVSSTTVISDQNRQVVSALGQDAIIEFNDVEGSYATNSFVINGMSFTAKNLTTDAVDITVSKDVDTIFDNIKQFVDKYNETIDLLNDKISEKRFRDFLPLTDEQKDAMSEDEIKKWNEKAMSGLLHSDDLLRKAVNSFRTSMTSIVSELQGSIKGLSDIGIASSNWQDMGHLYIDENKLRKSISENPDEVLQLFTNNPGDGANTNTGIAHRLFQATDNLINQITEKAGRETSVDTSYTIGKRMRDVDEEISRLQSRLDDIQTRYYRQFSMMETYINQMNQQSNFLASYFGVASGG